MKKKKSADERKAQKDQLKGILSDTQNCVWMELSSLTKFLTFASKFTRYSYNNQLLIYAQRPSATAVMTFGAWKSLGRNIKKGEKGIAIFAPYQRTFMANEKIFDADGHPVLDADGNQLKTKKKRQYTDFLVQYVYDISQTEGEPVPELTSISEDPLYETVGDLYDALCNVTPALGPIGNPDDLIYKVALDSFTAETGTANLDEVAAISYVLTSYLQLEVPDALAEQIFSWAKGMDMEELAKSMSRVQKVSKKIISGLEVAA